VVDEASIQVVKLVDLGFEVQSEPDLIFVFEFFEVELLADVELQNGLLV